jgi:prepilin-type processing-associated H-X9-DG protein
VHGKVGNFLFADTHINSYSQLESRFNPPGTNAGMWTINKGD